MIGYIQCKDCKHYYKFFKQITDEKGMQDFIVIPKCRIGYEISEEGTPAKPRCFEPRDKTK